MPFDATPICTVLGTPGNTGGDTNTANATGATLLTCNISYYSGNSFVSTVTDNFGNTFTARAQHRTAVQNLVQIFYDCVAPLPVGAGWKINVANTAFFIIPTIMGQAWKTSLAVSPLDTQSGAVSNAAATLQPGSVTPSEDGCLVLTACCHDNTSGQGTVNGGFTVSTGAAFVTSSAGHMGGALAYLVQSTVAASNPTWTVPGTSEIAVGQIVYKSNFVPPPPVFTDSGMMLSSGLYNLTEDLNYVLPAKTQRIAVLTTDGTIQTSENNTDWNDVTLDSNNEFNTSAKYIHVTGDSAIISMKELRRR